MYGNMPYHDRMSTTAPLKNARIEMRVTAEQKKLIERAAALEGRSVTDFTTHLVIEYAEDIVERERIQRMSEEAFDEFVDALDRPRRDIPGLRDLLTRTPEFRDA
jgi:uncharacterized protein (DUF1778 family)